MPLSSIGVTVIHVKSSSSSDAVWCISPSMTQKLRCVLNCAGKAHGFFHSIEDGMMARAIFRIEKG